MHGELGTDEILFVAAGGVLLCLMGVLSSTPLLLGVGTVMIGAAAFVVFLNG